MGRADSNAVGRTTKMKPEPLSHAQARRLMSDAWDAELEGDEQSRFAAHLATCEKCRRDARRMWSFLLDLEDLVRER